MTRYEWTSGPRLIERPERYEWHAGRAALEPKGPKIRLIVGRVRDAELNILVDWAKAAPRNPVNARLDVSALSEAIPRAADWSQTLMKGETGPIPKGWVIPPPDCEFVQGLII